MNVGHEGMNAEGGGAVDVLTGGRASEFGLGEGFEWGARSTSRGREYRGPVGSLRSE